MLDKIIHKHLDAMDEIERDIDEAIDEVFDSIDIKILISDPEQYLDEVVSTVKQMIEENYLERAVKLGDKLYEDVTKKEEIVVDDSTNPRKNEALDGNKG
jgi:hypothetical protein